MKIPKKLKIGGLTYTIEVVEKIDPDNDKSGLIESEKQKIQIAKGKQDYMNVVLIHEVLHALNMEIGEEKVEFLAQGIYQVIKDNPTLLK